MSDFVWVDLKTRPIDFLSTGSQIATVVLPSRPPQQHAQTTTCRSLFKPRLRSMWAFHPVYIVEARACTALATPSALTYFFVIWRLYMILIFFCTLERKCLCILLCFFLSSMMTILDVFEYQLCAHVHCFGKLPVWLNRGRVPRSFTWISRVLLFLRFLSVIDLIWLHFIYFAVHIMAVMLFLEKLHWV
jgi:hypothetical protein